jgi:nicotinamidase/pyrazinamidase
VSGTWGADLHPSLALSAEAPRVRKGANGEDGYSGFTMRDPVSGQTKPTELEAILRNARVRRAVVIGLATDYCVKATVLDARRRGLDVVVLDDAVRAVDVNPGDGTRAMDEMIAAGAHVVRLDRRAA